MFRNAAELVAQAKEQNVKIAEIMIQCEMETRSISREEVIVWYGKELSSDGASSRTWYSRREITNWFNWWRCCKSSSVYEEWKRLIRRYDFGRSKQSCCNK